MNSTWNYRLVRREGVVAIHEVYYDGKGKPRSVGAHPVPASGETKAEVVWALQKMRAALRKPVLDWEAFA